METLLAGSAAEGGLMFCFCFLFCIFNTKFLRFIRAMTLGDHSA